MCPAERLLADQAHWVLFCKGNCLDQIVKEQLLAEARCCDLQGMPGCEACSVLHVSLSGRYWAAVPLDLQLLSAMQHGRIFWQ